MIIMLSPSQVHKWSLHCAKPHFSIFFEVPKMPLPDLSDLEKGAFGVLRTMAKTKRTRSVAASSKKSKTQSDDELPYPIESSSSNPRETILLEDPDSVVRKLKTVLKSDLQQILQRMDDNTQVETLKAALEEQVFLVLCYA
jgi:hypothetical protein